jgi:high-affinity Fe2+/Pb2+ permease
MARHSSDAADQSVPGFGGPNDRAGSPDGQAALRLHAVIAVVAFVLCAFVSGIFFWMGTPVLGVIFAAIALVCLGVLGWALRLRRRAAAGRGR